MLSLPTTISEKVPKRVNTKTILVLIFVTLLLWNQFRTSRFIVSVVQDANTFIGYTFQSVINNSSDDALSNHISPTRNETLSMTTTATTEIATPRNISSSNETIATTTTNPTTSLSTNEVTSTLPIGSTILSLEELVKRTNTEVSCPPHTVLIEDYWAPSSTTTTNDGDSVEEPPRIPRTIHITSKSRCVTPKIYNNLLLWKNFAIKFHYNFIFHNDDAMEYLLQVYSHLYNPMLRQVLHCAISPTIKVDIWRAIVLYIYGGIYTDIDNCPGREWVTNVTTTKISSSSLSSETTSTKEEVIIKNTDEAFFVVERGGWLSQYFLASKPNHTLMKLLVDRCMERLLNQTDIYHLYIPAITGPGALKVSFMHYMNQSYLLYENHRNPNTATHKAVLYNQVHKGYFPSPIGDDSVTIAGDRSHHQDIIVRDSLGSKKADYLAMNMTDYHYYMSLVKDYEPIACRDLIVQKNTDTITTGSNMDVGIDSNNNNDTSVSIDQQIDQEIIKGSVDITRQYLFYNEEIDHLKHKANIQYKKDWLLAVQATRKQHYEHLQQQKYKQQQKYERQQLQRQQRIQEIDNNYHEKKDCTEDEIQLIQKQLSNAACHGWTAWDQQCSLTKATKCYDASLWLYDHYRYDYQYHYNSSIATATGSNSNNHVETIVKEIWIGLDVGCDTGLEAISTGRMISNGQIRSLQHSVWQQHMESQGVKTKHSCEFKNKQYEPFLGKDEISSWQETTSTIYPTIRRNYSTDDGDNNNIVHMAWKQHIFCIEQQPVKIHALNESASELDLISNQYMTITQAAIGITDLPTGLAFPTYNKDVDARNVNCDHNPDLCEIVPAITLNQYYQTYVQPYIDAIVQKDQEDYSSDQYNIQYKPIIKMLALDVDGNDYDVILGGMDVLNQHVVEYVEVEYHYIGSWSRQRLRSFIDASMKHYVCYFTGQNQLWKITGCFLDYYEYHTWSHIACVHPTYNPSLYQRMERLYLETIYNSTISY